MRYAVVAVQGSAAAQSNLAWILERSSAYDRQQRSEMCLRLLSQAAQGGSPDAWVDAGNIQYGNQQPGVKLEWTGLKCSYVDVWSEWSLAVMEVWMLVNLLGTCALTLGSCDDCPAVMKLSIHGSSDWCCYIQVAISVSIVLLMPSQCTTGLQNTSITITALQHCCGVINTTLLWLLSTGTLSWQRQWSYATAECQSTKPLTWCADDINVIHSMSTADTTALCTISGFTSNQGAFVSRWVLCLRSACDVESVKHAKLFCKLACSPKQILFVSLWGGCNTSTSCKTDNSFELQSKSKMQILDTQAWCGSMNRIYLYLVSIVPACCYLQDNI